MRNQVAESLNLDTEWKKKKVTELSDDGDQWLTAFATRRQSELCQKSGHEF